MAHAKVVHWYREVLKGTGKWTIKLSFTGGFPLPLDPTNPSDVEATDRYMAFQIGYITNPTFLGVQVPAAVVDTLGTASPTYTDSELAYVNGTMDFLAIDLYTAQYATTGPNSIEECAGNSSDPLWPYCVEQGSTRDGWLFGAQSNSGVYVRSPTLSQPPPPNLRFYSLWLPSRANKYHHSYSNNTSVQSSPISEALPTTKAAS